MENAKNFGRDEKEIQKRLRGIVTTKELQKMIATDENHFDQCLGLIKDHVLEDFIKPQVLNHFVKCLMFFKNEYIFITSNKEQLLNAEIEKSINTVIKANNKAKKKIKNEQQEIVRLYNTYLQIISKDSDQELMKFSLQTNKRNESFQLDYSKTFILNALKDAFNKKGFGFETLVEALDKDGNSTSDSDQKFYNITKTLENYLNNNGFPLKDIKAPQFIKELYQYTGIIEKNVSNETAYKRVAYYLAKSKLTS